MSKAKEKALDKLLREVLAFQAPRLAAIKKDKGQVVEMEKEPLEEHKEEREEGEEEEDIAEIDNPMQDQFTAMDMENGEEMGEEEENRPLLSMSEVIIAAKRNKEGEGKEKKKGKK